MRRISVDEVRAAVEKTGAILQKETCLSLGGPRPCGCGMGVLALAEHPEILTLGTFPYVFTTTAAYYLGLTRDYANGFASGFDGHPMPRVLAEGELTVGYADGKAVADALQPVEEDPA
jgi:hypothetical protein